MSSGSTGADLTTGGGGGGSPPPGSNILDALTKAMEALTKAIESKMGGAGKQTTADPHNSTLKNNLAQKALDNLTEKMDKFIERTKDGRKATQGMADTFENLWMRFRKFKDVKDIAPEKYPEFENFTDSLKATAKQLRADKFTDASKAIETSLSTMRRRLQDGRKVTQGSVDSFENLFTALKNLGVASNQTISSTENELIVLREKVKADRNAVRVAQDEVKANKAKRKAAKETAVIDKRDTLVDNITTGFKRFNAAAVPSQKTLYGLEDKLKRLKKLDPLNKLAGPFQKQLADAQKKRDEYSAKLTQTAKEAEYNTALKNLNKAKKISQDYYTELMAGTNITDKSIRKFEKLRSTISGLITAFNTKSTAAFGKNAKTFNPTLNQQPVSNLKIKQASDDALKYQQNMAEKTKKANETKQKALDKAFAQETQKFKALKDQIDLLGPSFTLGAKSAAKLFNELIQYRNEAVSRGATQKPFEDVFKTVSTKLKEAKDKKPETKSVMAKSSGIMSMIGKNISNSITGALTSGIAGPIMAVLGMVAAPFQDFINMLVNTIGVLIKWVFVITGILGFFKRLELQLAAFNARMEFSSDRMLSLDTAVQRVATGITKSVNELGSSVVHAVDNALMNPLTGFADIVNKISKFVSLVNPGLMEQYNRVMDNLMALIGSALQPVVIEITNLMYQFGVQLKPVIEVLGGYLAKALRALAMSLIPLIPQIIMGLTQLAGALIGYVGTMAVKIAGGTREERIKEETARRNKADKLDQQTILGSARLTAERQKGRKLNEQLATVQVDREIKQEQSLAKSAGPSNDFMDMAVAKNARFTGGMDMGKSSVQKAFEASSTFGIQNEEKQKEDELKKAQLNFYQNPEEWLKRAMGIMGAPPQVAGGGGGSADGSHLNPLQKLNMTGQLLGAFGGGIKAGVKDLTFGLVR